MKRLLLLALLVLFAATMGPHSSHAATTQDLQNVQISKTATPTAQVGDIFTHTTSVKNNSNGPLQLSLYETLPAESSGVQIVSVSDTSFAENNPRVYTFQLTLGPGETKAVTYQLKATVAGTFGTTAEVCDSSANCSPVIRAGTEVHAAPPPPPPPPPFCGKPYCEAIPLVVKA